MKQKLELTFIYLLFLTNVRFFPFFHHVESSKSFSLNCQTKLKKRRQQTLQKLSQFKKFCFLQHTNPCRLPNFYQIGIPIKAICSNLWRQKYKVKVNSDSQWYVKGLHPYDSRFEIWKEGIEHPFDHEFRLFVF